MVSDVPRICRRTGQGIDALKKDLGKVRTGRANVAILDGLRVDYYGTPTPLNQVSSVSAPDPRLITIKPWEKSLIPEIEKVIRSSSLGLNPSSDGEIVRLPMPPLTEERRKDLVKMVQEDGRDCKVALRNARRRRQRDAEGVSQGQRHHRRRGEGGLEEGAGSHRHGGDQGDDLVARKEKE